MILRDRVGGGGREKSAGPIVLAGGRMLDNRLFCPDILTVGDVGEAGWWEESDLTDAFEDMVLPAEAIAGGGSVKDIWLVDT